MRIQVFSEGQVFLCWAAFKTADLKEEELASRVVLLIDFKRPNMGKWKKAETN